MNSGDILVLENLRFYPGEGSKDKALRLEMARILASYADLYVSDAFGTAHRDAASMTGVPEVCAAKCAVRSAISPSRHVPSKWGCRFDTRVIGLAPVDLVRCLASGYGTRCFRISDEERD